MRLPKIADTNLCSNLIGHYRRRLASLGGKLQKVLDDLTLNLAPYPGIDWVEQKSTGVGNFLVTPYVVPIPGKDIVTVTYDDFTADVDPSIALEMLQQVPPYDAEGNRVDPLTVMLTLGQAETASGLGEEMHSEDPEAMQGTPWEMDKYGRRIPFNRY